MGILCFLVGVLAVAAVSADDSCPSASDISPCTCDGEGVNCMKAKSIDDIKKAFKVNYKYGGVRSVWIQGTNITSIPADTFGPNFKTKDLYIEINKITTVNLDALKNFAHILGTFSCFGNEINNFNFPGLSSLSALHTLNLARNKLTTIPDNAFPNLSQLRTLIMAQNPLTNIGMNAFFALSNLQNLNLLLCQLNTLGPYSLALSARSPGLQIHLAANQISSIDSTALEGAAPQYLNLAGNRLSSLKSEAFLNVVNNIGGHGGVIDVSGNPLTCRGCDYSWIADNKYFLQNVFIGFFCIDGRNIMGLTRFNIGC